MTTKSTNLFRALLFTISIFCVSCNPIGGAFDSKPEDLEEQISAEARMLIDQAFDADTEWLLIDAPIIRAHQHAAGAKGGSRRRH